VHLVAAPCCMCAGQLVCTAHGSHAGAIVAVGGPCTTGTACLHGLECALLLCLPTYGMQLGVSIVYGLGYVVIAWPAVSGSTGTAEAQLVACMEHRYVQLMRKHASHADTIIHCRSQWHFVSCMLSASPPDAAINSAAPSCSHQGYHPKAFFSS
jgi:hypothetical protein